MGKNYVDLMNQPLWMKRLCGVIKMFGRPHGNRTRVLRHLTNTSLVWLHHTNHPPSIDIVIYYHLVQTYIRYCTYTANRERQDYNDFFIKYWGVHGIYIFCRIALIVLILYSIVSLKAIEDQFRISFLFLNEGV